jgi:hypothetical protein
VIKVIRLKMESLGQTPTKINRLIDKKAERLWRRSVPAWRSRARTATRHQSHNLAHRP